MKRKTMMAMFCALVLCVLTGCRLAQENAGTNAHEDRLVGILVTTEYLDLFGFESYLNDNLSDISGGQINVDGNTQKYQGRMYATLTTRILTSEETGEISEIEEYVFPGVEGIAYFSSTVPATAERDSYISAMSDAAISDGITNMYVGDDKNSTTMEGTIYVSSINGEHTYYFNPVYQSSDGSVYALSGSGMSSQGMDSEGSAMSHTVDATYTVMENGKPKTDSISITLFVNVMFAPEKIVILQMDTDNKLLSRMEYAPDALPEVITSDADAAYLIVETQKRDAAGVTSTTRNIYSKDADAIETFFAREDGVCIKLSTEIKWSD